jgi:hypothetical protein
MVTSSLISFNMAILKIHTNHAKLGITITVSVKIKRPKAICIYQGQVVTTQLEISTNTHKTLPWQISSVKCVSGHRLIQSDVHILCHDRCKVTVQL